MSESSSPYTVKRLASGSYDVLLDGVVIAALTRDIDGSFGTWRIELLSENHSAQPPPPFEAQVYTFNSFRVALNWLGILKNKLPTRASTSNSTDKNRRHLTHLIPSERYQLRLLNNHSRFYTQTHAINGLILHGFIAPTGQKDNEGRSEWLITDAGRLALAEIEP